MSEYYYVRIYLESATGNWEEMCMGSANLERESTSESVRIVISDMELNELYSYLFQESTEVTSDPSNPILIWPDKAKGTRVAMSFFSEQYCVYISSRIKRIMPREVDPYDLPPCTMGTLQQIALELERASSGSKDSLVVALTRNKNQYLTTLVDVYSQLEDLEDESQLQFMARIFRQMIFFNSRELFLVLFSRDFFMQMVTSMEYHPMYPQRPDFHSFVAQKSFFKQIVEIHNENIVSLIHQNFRIQYFKDAVIPLVPDDQSLSELTNLWKDNSNNILHFFIVNERLLEQLSATLEIETICNQTLSFFNELYITASQTNIDIPREITTTLFRIPTFKSNIIRMLSSPSIFSLQLLQSILLADASSVRSLIEPSDAPLQWSATSLSNLPFLQSIIQSLWMAAHGVQEMCFHTIMSLGGISSGGWTYPFTSDMEKNTFLDLFYSVYMPLLVFPVTAASVVSTIDGDAYLRGTRFFVDILSSFIKFHDVHIQTTISSSFLKSVIGLISLNMKPLNLTILGLLRELLETPRIYGSLIEKSNVMQDVLSLWIKNSSQQNLIECTIREMIEFIGRNRYISLIEQILNFDGVDRIESPQLDALREIQKAELQQSTNGELTTDRQTSVHEIRNSAIREREREDDYFNSDDNESETVSSDDMDGDQIAFSPAKKPRLE